MELERWDKLDPSNLDSGGSSGGTKIDTVNPMLAGDQVSLVDGSTAGRVGRGKRRRRSTRDLSEVLGEEEGRDLVPGMLEDDEKSKGRKKGWA